MMALRMGRLAARRVATASSSSSASFSPSSSVASRTLNASSNSVRRFASSSSNNSSSSFSYNALLESHPILTKSVTSMCVVGGGDWICQYFIEKRKEIQWKRVGTMGIIGLTLAGPLLHHWFGFLFRTFPGTGLTSTLKKIAMDQGLFAPVFNPLFIGYIYLLEGRPGDIVDFMKNDWFNVTINNWSLWGPANFINFMFVPAAYQVLFANFTGVIWNCYISWKSHHSHTADHAEADAGSDPEIVELGTVINEGADEAAADESVSSKTN